MPNRILIKGVPFDQVTRLEAVQVILNFLKQDKQFFVTTPNPEFLVETTKNAEFKKVLIKANLSVADGIGILWASTYLQLRTTNYILPTIKTLLWTFFTRMEPAADGP